MSENDVDGVRAKIRYSLDEPPSNTVFGPYLTDRGNQQGLKSSDEKNSCDVGMVLPDGGGIS
jgi:hypothetical protein